MNFRKGCLVIMALMAASVSLAAEVTVGNAYVRATPPGMTVTAAFFQLNNNSAQDVRLVGVSVEDASNAELHTHKNNAGMMQMREVESVLIPANGTAVLEPGGLHVMIFGVSRPLKPGATVDMTLTFDNGESIKLEPEIRKIVIQ